MNLLASLFVVASAAILFVLGAAHLLFTVRGPKLLPRDAALQARMKETSPVITRQTTMWKCWLGFNVSHSIALLLFGAVYGYLALAESELLFRSVFLLALGLAVLLAYVVLARRYFFSTPFAGVVVATLLYAGALVASRVQGP